MTTNRSDFAAHSALASQAAVNALDARTRALLAAGVASARSAKARRVGPLVRFWRYIGGAA